MFDGQNINKLLYNLLMKNYYKTGTLFSNGLLGVANLLNLDGQSKRAVFNYGAFLGILFQLVGSR